MAVTFTGTNISFVNDNTGFGVWKRDGTGGTPSAISETDVFLQGTGACSVKVSNQGIVLAFAHAGLNLSGTNVHLAIWCQMLAGPLMKVRDSTTVPGLAMFLSSDATLTTGSNYNMWAVDGSDTYPGGWVRYIIDVSKTASTTVGTLNLAAVRHIGMYCNTQPNVAKFDNLVIDRMDYLTPGQGLRFTGVSPVGSWEELFTQDDNVSNKYGVIEKRNGLYTLQGSVDIGDDAGTGATTWTDSGGAIVTFKNPRYYNGTADALCVSDDFYRIKLQGNATGATNITIGSVVGSGDDRQGVKGGTVRTAGPEWSMDASTDIGHLTTAKFYGLNFEGAGRGLTFDDGNKTSIISCLFNNCGEIELGTTNNGAEMLSCAVIDPDDSIDARNAGLRFASQPTHNVKRISFITSGTPTTQHMVHLTPAADYSTSFDAIKFFGSYASSTIWHGENSGTNADVTISPTNDANPTAAEFENTASGTVAVSNPAVTATVNVKDENNNNLQSARVYLRAQDGSGPMPYQDSVTITRSGTTATVSHTAHGMETGDKVVIKGITNTLNKKDNNGTHTITVTGANAYTYTTLDEGDTTYTGTIISTWVAIDADTDASGNASRTKSYATNQPVDGWVRKSTASPRYKTFPIAGTINTSSGLTINVKMVRDE